MRRCLVLVIAVLALGCSSTDDTSPEAATPVATAATSSAQSPSDSGPRMDPLEARARLRVRLQPPEFVAAVPGMAAVEVADGLLATLVLVFPDASMTVVEEQLTDWDLDVDEAYRIALANIEADGEPAHQAVSPGPGLGTVHVHGELLFTSSWALLVDRLVTEDSPHGVVVAIATRENLDLHVVDATSRPTIDVMAAVTYEAYNEGPGAITDELFWWHDGVLTTIPTIDGRVLTLPEELAAVIGG